MSTIEIGPPAKVDRVLEVETTAEFARVGGAAQRRATRRATESPSLNVVCNPIPPPAPSTCRLPDIGGVIQPWAPPETYSLGGLRAIHLSNLRWRPEGARATVREDSRREGADRHFAQHEDYRDKAYKTGIIAIGGANYFVESARDFVTSLPRSLDPTQREPPPRMPRITNPDLAPIAPRQAAAARRPRGAIQLQLQGPQE